MSKKEKLFKPIVETKDKLLLRDFINLEAINTYFAHINTLDMDKNESENDSNSPLLFTTVFYFLDNN